MLIRVAVLLLASVLLAPAASAQPRPIDLLPGHRLFSPDGDGRKDRLPVRFLLRERAAVSVQVHQRGSGRQVRTVRLGTLRSGEHVWRWNGRSDAGRLVPDGRYRIRLTAVGASRTGVARSTAYIDRGQGLRKARLWLNRDTLYPQTPEIQDRIYIRGTTGGIRTDLAIRDANGRVVKRLAIHGWSSWAALDDSGSPVPSGEYDARVTFSDHYGNRRTTHRTLTVSDEALVQKTWSTTVRAADAELGSGDGYCPLPPSARFEGGLTLAITEDCERAVFRPRVEVPFRLDPTSSWRVSVAGGPTTAGEPDSGVISLSDDYSTIETTTAPGDATTTTPWGAVSRIEWARPRDWVFWLAVGEEASYDVATYTLEVRYWTAD